MDEEGPPDLPMALWPQVHVLPGARELLTALAPRYTLCIATNASVSRRADIEAALERGGLRSFFTHVFCFTEIGARKDSPRFWEAVARTLACTPAEIAMLGDSLEQDVLGPAALGVQAVWFNREARPVPPGVREVRRLRDFADFL
jgi:FMN phosphatase YigB (HAD superfamily)